MKRKIALLLISAIITSNLSFASVNYTYIDNIKNKGNNTTITNTKKARSDKPTYTVFEGTMQKGLIISLTNDDYNEFNSNNKPINYKFSKVILGKHKDRDFINDNKDRLYTVKDEIIKLKTHMVDNLILNNNKDTSREEIANKRKEVEDKVNSLLQRLNAEGGIKSGGGHDDNSLPISQFSPAAKFTADDLLECITYSTPLTLLSNDVKGRELIYEACKELLGREKLIEFEQTQMEEGDKLNIRVDFAFIPKVNMGEVTTKSTDNLINPVTEFDKESLYLVSDYINIEPNTKIEDINTKIREQIINTESFRIDEKNRLYLNPVKVDNGKYLHSYKVKAIDKDNLLNEDILKLLLTLDNYSITLPMKDDMIVANTIGLDRVWFNIYSNYGSNTVDNRYSALADKLDDTFKYSNYLTSIVNSKEEHTNTKLNSTLITPELKLQYVVKKEDVERNNKVKEESLITKDDKDNKGDKDDKKLVVIVDKDTQPTHKYEPVIPDAGDRDVGVGEAGGNDSPYLPSKPEGGSRVGGKESDGDNSPYLPTHPGGESGDVVGGKDVGNNTGNIPNTDDNISIEHPPIVDSKDEEIDLTDYISIPEVARVNKGSDDSISNNKVKVECELLVPRFRRSNNPDDEITYNSKFDIINSVNVFSVLFSEEFKDYFNLIDLQFYNDSNYELSVKPEDINKISYFRHFYHNEKFRKAMERTNNDYLTSLQYARVYSNPNYTLILQDSRTKVIFEWYHVPFTYEINISDKMSYFLNNNEGDFKINIKTPIILPLTFNIDLNNDLLDTLDKIYNNYKNFERQEFAYNSVILYKILNEFLLPYNNYVTSQHAYTVKDLIGENNLEIYKPSLLTSPYYTYNKYASFGTNKDDYIAQYSIHSLKADSLPILDFIYSYKNDILEEIDYEKIKEISKQEFNYVWTYKEAETFVNKLPIYSETIYNNIFNNANTIVTKEFIKPIELKDFNNLNIDFEGLDVKGYIQLLISCMNYPMNMLSIAYFFNPIINYIDSIHNLDFYSAKLLDKEIKVNESFDNIYKFSPKLNELASTNLQKYSFSDEFIDYLLDPSIHKITQQVLSMFTDSINYDNNDLEKYLLYPVKDINFSDSVYLTNEQNLEVYNYLKDKYLIDYLTEKGEMDSIDKYDINIMDDNSLSQVNRFLSYCYDKHEDELKPLISKYIVDNYDDLDLKYSKYYGFGYYLINEKEVVYNNEMDKKIDLLGETFLVRDSFIERRRQYGYYIVPSIHDKSYYYTNFPNIANKDSDYDVIETHLDFYLYPEYFIKLYQEFLEDRVDSKKYKNDYMTKFLEDNKELMNSN